MRAFGCCNVTNYLCIFIKLSKTNETSKLTKVVVVNLLTTTIN